METMYGSSPVVLRRTLLGAGALALALVAMAACDGVVSLDGVRGPETVAGHWVGQAGTDAVEMTLQQPDSVTVTGFGVFHRPGSALAFRVEGIRGRSNITLLLEVSVPGIGETGSALAHYGAEFVGTNRIEGTLAGAGYTNTPMDLRRDRTTSF
jgi:hypothetical protein